MCLYLWHLNDYLISTVALFTPYDITLYILWLKCAHAAWFLSKLLKHENNNIISDIILCMLVVCVTIIIIGNCIDTWSLQIPIFYYTFTTLVFVNGAHKNRE